jgi:hypothetical protein
MIGGKISIIRQRQIIMIHSNPDKLGTSSALRQTARNSNLNINLKLNGADWAGKRYGFSRD